MIFRSALLALALACAPALALAQPVPPAGLAAEGQKRWERALAIYRAALAREPGRHDLWLRVSQIEGHLGRKLAAAEALRAAAEARRTDAALWRSAQAAFSVADRPRESLAMLERAAALEPGRVDDLLTRAQLATWLGDYPMAATAYEEHYKRTAAPDSLLNLARVLGWQGRTDAASRRFREYRRLRPDDPAAALDHTRLEGWRGNFAGALEILDDHERRHGASVPYRQLRAEIYARGGHWFSANAQLESLPEPQRSDFSAHFTRALAAHETGRVATAFAEIEQARRLQPGDRGLADLARAAEVRSRSSIEGVFGYAFDSDKIHTITGGAVASLRVDRRLYLEAGGVTDTLRAQLGSGLETIDGRRWAAVYRAWGGARGALSDTLWASLRLGSTLTNRGDSAVYYAGALEAKPLDGLLLRLDAEHDYHAVSPRAISRGIRRHAQLATMVWQFPDLRHTVVAAAGYDFFSDGNRRWSALIEPRRAILRTQYFNLDVGLSGRWSGFLHDFDNGYYDPILYQQYLVVVYGYIKLSDDDGIAIALAPGVHKDERMKHFAASGSAQVEGTFGIYRAWQLKLAGGTGVGIGVNERTYQRTYGTIRLLHRF
jgi:tetratricopeptide (TPR) repeat protein